MKKFKIIIIFSCLLFLTTGCLKKDSLEDITIYTTAYPIEFISSYLYGEHSTIKSIYPDGVDINNYELTDKQITDYSAASMFIFNGLSNEAGYVAKLVSKNKKLMIIDSSQSIEYKNDIEELWVDPSNLLMMALNIKNGLSEYISNHYLKADIESNYERLKVELSNLDARLKLLSENADNKTIIVDNDIYKYLEKYGFEVISLDDDTISEKTLTQAKTYLKESNNQYIYVINKNDISDEIQKILDETDTELIELDTISNLTEEERYNKEDYISIFNSNIEKLKSALYN